LFSGGKDSIVLVHLAIKAFWPARIPFTLTHIDTGHNFEETLIFRDTLVEKTGARLVVGSVQASIDQGRAVEEVGYNASRNVLQTVTLLDTIESEKLDVAIGGGRRDEETARAKERFFSHRDEFGQWDPKNQRPELWNLSMAESGLGSISGYSPSQTGPRWMYGNISTWKTSSYLACILHISGRYSAETVCCWLMPPS
jgi:sulfate adenylyltransferase subunit 2